MSVIKAEILEEFINDGNFKVDVLGPLHFPIKDLTIKRDEKLNLVLTTTSDVNSESGSIDHPPGTVRINDDAIELTSISESKVKMNGIQPFKYTISTDNNGNSIRTELSSVSSIEAVIRDAKTGNYLIEWLENVDDGHFMWPDSVETNTENHTLVSIGAEPNKVEMQEKSSSKGFGRSAVYLSIADHKLYLVSTGDDAKSVGVKSGYILYLEIIPSEERKKIRDCLSFVLGRPLIKTGYSIFNSEWQLVSFKSISAYSMGGAAFSIHSLPPFPLGKNYQGEIDSNIITTLVNAIYQDYDEYKFGYLSWAYWHAVCAPIHIAAVHFGACIESLQKSYIENNGKKFSSALIEKSRWKVFRKETLNVLTSLNLEETENRVLENKINSLNQTPQSVLTERFLNNLDINFSEVEKAAWQQRNNAAHGNEIEEGTEIQLIREIKILKVIFHRVLLKIMGGGEYYIDYYSIGFPIKFLSDSIDTNA
ncbi:MAG: hypothetical protein GQ532_06305 [Methylomarinum sp.]|nr:hypothetical protein [Methylomarinum sp.]